MQKIFLRLYRPEIPVLVCQFSEFAVKWIFTTEFFEAVYGCQRHADLCVDHLGRRRNFRKMQDRITEPYQKAVGRGKITDAIAAKILSRCMAKHIIKGWKGLRLDGKEIEYSEEKALELMLDPTLNDFKEQVLLESQRIENYREERLEDDLKNLEESSSTAQGGTKKGKSSSKT